MPHFKNSFWSQKQPGSTLPDFQSGFTVLHQKLTQSKVENEELLTFFKDRIAHEESYATKLVEQSKVSFKSSGFGRDEGATLKSCFGKLKESAGHVGGKHRETAAAMNSQVLKPLQDFHEEYKRNVVHSKLAIESMLKQFDGLVKETEKARYAYHKKCREKEMAPKSTVTAATEGTPSTLQLGNQIMVQSELEELVRRMKKEITVQDYKVPILGTYKYTSTGEDIAVWLQHNLPQCKDSPAMADVVGQQLIQPYNILRLVGQRGNRFTASSSCYYQWRSEDDMDEVEKANELYHGFVRKLDQMRMAIEGAMFAHLNEMEQLELKRISYLKQRVEAFIHCLELSQHQEIENMKVFHESLKPDQDIQYIIQQYTVSGFSPKAILYDNYHHGVYKDQVFGVPLEELGKASENKVPQFISTLLAAIQQGSDTLAENKDQVWITPCALDRVHAACLELNGPQGLLTVEMLSKYEPALLVAILRYFLLELPDCIMTYEMYEPVKTILSGNEESRLASSCNLISTLPDAHFFTLKAIVNHLQPIVQNTSSDIVHAICQSLGPNILRPKSESYTTLNSKIPVQWMHFLLEQDLFSESTLKLHAESEKRRQAKPIVVSKEEKKNANSLMSLIVDENKWSSVMGVFQRNQSSSPTSSVASPTVEPKSSISLSFGSTVITQSPPQSPKLVMFDGEDIFNDKVEDTSFFDDDD
ncbi:hypothetical protein G6F43_009084 [Rhizopus delemar]|nr:hypothetical protein G6F43_009084 [Rhizopus delemar]